MRRLFPAGGPVDLDRAYAYHPNDRGTAARSVRANMVATVDGAASGADGLSGSVSGHADKLIFATLRRLADVVLVGASTVRAEGYRPAGVTIAVVSGRLDLDLTAPLYAAAPHRTIIITCQSAPADRLDQARAVADVLVCGDQSVDLALAVAALNGAGFDRLLCEGGPMLLRQVAAAGLLDELCLTIAPYLAGGGAGRILGGDPFTTGLQVSLTQLLEDAGWLFARYAVRP